MGSFSVHPLQDELEFGAIVRGVDRQALDDERLRQRLREVFEDRGLIVFEGIEPSSQMQLALSTVFGPLKDHPVPSVSRVDQDEMPGVIDMKYNPETSGIYEVNGKVLVQWLPWHFDHCYNNELNRAGVLRAATIPPEGGLTLFADGIQLYRAISEDIRDELEGLKVIYTLNLSYDDMRFGRPHHLRVIRPDAGLYAVQEQATKLPRAIHPAIWTRKSGEKVLHISPWGAVGIEGHEDSAGDQLLEAVCQQIDAKARPYAHKWSPTDMLIWDNWRMMHAVSGMDPGYSRRMQRTTIKGDYGLGYFEKSGTGNAILETTV